MCQDLGQLDVVDLVDLVDLVRLVPQAIGMILWTDVGLTNILGTCYLISTLRCIIRHIPTIVEQTVLLLD